MEGRSVVAAAIRQAGGQKVEQTLGTDCQHAQAINRLGGRIEALVTRLLGFGWYFGHVRRHSLNCDCEVGLRACLGVNASLEKG
ncbi:hypothetical protein D3C85_651640 [compost metagenome]